MRALNEGKAGASAGIVRPVRVGPDAGVVASVVAVDSGPVPTADRDVISDPDLVDGVPGDLVDPEAVVVDSVGILPKPARAGDRVVPGTDAVPIAERLLSR